MKKTVIITPFGLFVFPKMRFGMCNSAQTFQRLINMVLFGLDSVIAYTHDILIASVNEEEHQKHIQIVFGKFREFGLTINLEKCEFGEAQLTFLGHLITAYAGKSSRD